MIILITREARNVVGKREGVKPDRMRSQRHTGWVESKSTVAKSKQLLNRSIQRCGHLITGQFYSRNRSKFANK